jgi:hypothetical protein
MAVGGSFSEDRAQIDPTDDATDHEQAKAVIVRESLQVVKRD